MNRGSEWLRWDVHIHTPGTALNNQYPADSWGQYIARINEATPRVAALGITDYLSIRNYTGLRSRWLAKELPGVRFVFPNIEFRVSPPTQKHKGVNIHLLIDPSDDDHIERITDALGRLTFRYGPDGALFNCNETGLIALGKKLDPKQLNDAAAYSVGVNAFKIDFSVLRDWYCSDGWLKAHSLIAVSNNDNDGVSGLSPEHGYGPTIDEMFRFAHIVFSGNPTDRRYWLGEGSDKSEVLKQRFGGAKPCLHGSDAHELSRVLAPDGDRLCWIRAEPTFEGLRQVVFEPRERVQIGPDQPARLRQNWIRSVGASAHGWFPESTVELNDGLVAIIGPRGSGKTALSDLVAHGADAYESGPASFLRKAEPEARGTEVTLSWADRDEPVVRVVGQDAQDYPSVRYLSQHFVEQLCSADGANERLVQKIEEVVFDALDETERADASSFEELRGLVTEDSVRRIQERRSDIALCSDLIAREQLSKAELPAKRERLSRLDAEVLQITKSLSGLVVKGKEEKAKALEKVRDGVAALERDIAGLKSRVRRLNEWRLNLEQQARTALQTYETLKDDLRDLGIAEADLDAFRFSFSGDVSGILTRRSEAIEREIVLRTSGQPTPGGIGPGLEALKLERERLQKEVGGDTVKERQFVDLQRKQKAKQEERIRLDAEIKRAGSADGIIKETQVRRLEHYVGVFEELRRQQAELDRLYRPLGDLLAAAPPERRKLTFYVRLVADIEGWAERGEQLLDLRRKGEFFRDPGSLAKKAEEVLGEAWRQGDSNKVRAGMSEVLSMFKDASKLLAPTATLANFADWLFSTDHISVTYGIKYENTDIERLSPGTRGIVLMILYLALDTQDDRPLIIDQPEENLDPQSIFDVLTGYFRETRRRRQVIIVTHNPNLVVNTDSDQVIVAHSERIPGEVLPRLSYESGGLENPSIRSQVCHILEGGEQAFKQREQRYRLG